MWRLYTMIELASGAIWTVELSVKVFAFFSAVVIVDMHFCLKLMFTMSKRTFWSKLTLAELPVPADFSFELLLKVLCRCWLDFWTNSLILNIIVRELLIVVCLVDVTIIISVSAFFLFWSALTVPAKVWRSLLLFYITWLSVPQHKVTFFWSFRVFGSLLCDGVQVIVEHWNKLRIKILLTHALRIVNWFRRTK